ncbi:MAG: hypothetical protein C0597_15360 [Marinilabiliales bacterium]|nr:MAG: hypothetical protein C0597_15360 [Marinilabiliales bacterium]
MKNTIITLLFVLTTIICNSQNTKKSLSSSDYDDWKYIEDKAISNDGNWILYESNPYQGDGKVVFYNANTKQKTKFERAKNAIFSPNSDFAAFKTYPYKDTLRALKLGDTPKDELPKDSLVIFILGAKEIIKIEDIQSFEIAKEESSWMAYLYKKNVPVDTTKKDDEKEKEIFDDEAPKEYDFTILNPIKNKKLEFKNITEYSLSENGKLIGFIKQQNDSLLKSTIYLYNTEDERLDSLSPTDGLVKKLTIDHKGNQLAYIQSLDTVETKVFSLFYYHIKEKTAKKVVDTLSNEIPEKWTVSESGSMYFSNNDSRLFFGIAYMPQPEPEDTLLEEEKVVLDLWSWTDSKLQPQQLSELDDNLNESYTAVYLIKKQKIIQLEDETAKHIEFSVKGNGNYALVYNYKPYEKQTSWEFPEYFDIYILNIETGEKTLFKKRLKAEIGLSSMGNFIFWYSYNEKAWFSYSLKNKSIQNLTGSINLNFFDEENDYPMDAYPYGISGWIKDDKYILIRDRYDIWKIDPTMKQVPVNLTNQYGRKNNIRLIAVDLNPDEDFIDPKEEILLRAFNYSNKQSGYYKTNLSSKSDPNKIVMDDYLFSRRPLKAKNANRIIWQKQSFKEYYDIWTSSLDFSEMEKISDENPQQDNFLWGNVDLVKWITPDGTEEEGLLYKPENFDSNKKYPMIVYFYRLHSDDIHYYYVPKPSRSVINPTFYTSNGYFVFMPNIRYKEGYPGESAYNYVVSGTLALLTERNYLDKDKIGIQGQSWGGYQAGFIITRTDLFSAASIGAPVSNMTSAYGGIRWTSGMSRMFQYEKTQSRIGGTLWEKPLNYIENSPVFYAPKINTPVLIRHNDGDGAVPWYQGIEYFVALRRLNKPVWMLNYNDQPHNEKRRSPNNKDLSKRMMQFFDHYLKNEPAPIWMTQGIPATKKGKTLGYELDK